MECVMEMIGSTVDRELNKEKFARMGRAKRQSTTARLNMLTISSPGKRNVTEISVVTPSKRRMRLGSKGEEEGRVRSIFEKLSLPGTRLLTSARTSPNLPTPPLTSFNLTTTSGKLDTSETPSTRLQSKLAWVLLGRTGPLFLALVPNQQTS